MRSIFVTGGTGLIGSRVLPRLLAAGDLHLYLLLRHRPGRPIAVPAHPRITPVLGDLRVPGLGIPAARRKQIVERAHGILHMAADIGFSRPLPEARAVNVAGTANLLDGFADAGCPIAFVSTAFVAGRRTGRIGEDDHAVPDGWVNAYEQSKWEAENQIRTSGRPFTILRSSTVVCDDEGGGVTQVNAVHRALRLLHAGLAPMLPGRDEAPVDLIPADFAASAVAELAFREDLVGRTLHICAGAGRATLGELLDLAMAAWAEDPEWRRRGVARPRLTSLETYRLFESSVELAGDARLRQIVRSLGHFAPQLALEKRFDTSGANGVLGRTAPVVTSYWPSIARHLARDHWRAVRRREAA